MFSGFLRWGRRGAISRLGLTALLVSIGLLGAPVLGFAAQKPKPKPTPSAAEGTEAKPDAKAKAAADRAALQLERQAARQAERKAAEKAKAKAAAAKFAAAMAQRPERAVVEPTMTPADLDAMIASFLAKESPDAKPAPPITDADFIRRVSFDLAGVPPTAEEVEAFVADKSPDKRARLIDARLADPDFARNWARYWREVIQYRATNPNANQVRFDEFEDWLAEQFQKNRPWDAIAQDLITATGRQDENAAVAFGLAHQSRPVEMAGEVSRVFMGVQIQCAECHNHFTDSWKREQFHEFAAFFAGSRTRRVEKNEKGKRAVFAVETLPRAGYAMPLKNEPSKKVPVAPKFFLASSESELEVPAGLPPDKLHELAASFVTGQDNPWFARSYVNRIWTVLMGEGFYEVVDDLGPERTAKGDEILYPLADQWQRGGYDVRWLFRTIVNTQAYQRRPRPTSAPGGDAPLVANRANRLRADQILEALDAALGLNVSPASNGKGNDKDKGKAAKPAPPRQAAARTAFNNLFGVDPSVDAEEVLGTIPQALFLMNSGIVHNRTMARPATELGQILKRTKDDKAAVDELYLLVLARRPNKDEAKICADHLTEAGEKDRGEAFEDIYWSLVNSTEFLSRR